jgi:hypothetical protein
MTEKPKKRKMVTTSTQTRKGGEQGDMSYSFPCRAGIAGRVGRVLSFFY